MVYKVPACKCVLKTSISKFVLYEVISCGQILCEWDCVLGMLCVVRVKVLKPGHIFLLYIGLALYRSVLEQHTELSTCSLTGGCCEKKGVWDKCLKYLRTCLVVELLPQGILSMNSPSQDHLEIPGDSSLYCRTEELIPVWWNGAYGEEVGGMNRARFLQLEKPGLRYVFPTSFQKYYCGRTHINTTLLGSFVRQINCGCEVLTTGGP